jgi:hypothetical protein
MNAHLCYQVPAQKIVILYKVQIVYNVRWEGYYGRGGVKKKGKNVNEKGKRLRKNY